MINRVSLEKAVYVLKIAVVGPPRSGKSIIVATLLFFLRDHLNVDIKHVQTDVKDIVVPQIIRGEKPIKRKEFDLKEYYERLKILEKTEAEIVITDAPGRLTKQLDDLIQRIDAIIFVHKSLEDWEKDAQIGRADPPAAWKERIEKWEKEILLEIETYLSQDFSKMVLDFERKKCKIPITTGRERGIMTNHPGMLAIAYYIKECVKKS